MPNSRILFKINAVFQLEIRDSCLRVEKLMRRSSQVSKVYKCSTKIQSMSCVCRLQTLANHGVPQALAAKASVARSQALTSFRFRLGMWSIFRIASSRENLHRIQALSRARMYLSMTLHLPRLHLPRQDLHAPMRSRSGMSTRRRFRR